MTTSRKPGRRQRAALADKHGTITQFVYQDEHREATSYYDEWTGQWQGMACICCRRAGAGHLSKLFLICTRCRRAGHVTWATTAAICGCLQIERVEHVRFQP